MPAFKNSLFMKVIVVVLFALILTGLRMLWNNYFQHETNQPMAEAGVLDLRDWDFAEKGSVTMSGEWSFYPYTFVEKIEQDSPKSSYIDVPGSWARQLNGDEEHPYGYGTYYLRIHVDTEKSERFKVQVPSVRSASKLYANGEYIGGSGRVGKNAEETYAHNIPYISSTVRPNAAGDIHLYLEAANFIDPRVSGLIRSIKIGLEDEVVAETNLSIVLQTMAGVIFLVHALFAILIYAIGIRDRRLLYAFVILIVLAFINTTFGDEKIFYQFVTVDYAFSLKAASLASLILFLSFIHVIQKQLEQLSRYIVPTLTVVYVLFIGVLLWIPIEQLERVITVMSYIALLTIVITLVGLFKGLQEETHSYAIIFSILAVMSHLFWFFYFMTTGFKVVHYPFDLIIAVVCIAVVWFKQYYNLHQESLALTEKLTMIDETKDEFLASTSHELRNPLHSILNISKALLKREKNSLHEASMADLETIHSVSKRMSSMVNDLLDVATIEGGTPKLERKPLSMKAITAGVMDMVTYSIEGKQVPIHNNIPSTLPAVDADENRIIQVMFNLLHNALKYTDEGKITVTAEERKDFVAISVSDTGAGMAEETLTHVFDRYVQGMNAEKISEGGFGIGLYVSQQLIELHGGTIDVESEKGKGTTFTFTLPIATEAVDFSSAELASPEAFYEAAASTVSAPSEPIEETAPLIVAKDRPRILVVDDEKVNLRVIETVLTPEAYDMTFVLSGQEALERLDEWEWDLVIADVMMPHMSGYTLTRRIRKRFALFELPVLLVTARSSQKDIETGFASGANDYITKPIDAIELRSRVNALTSARKAARERLQLEAAWLQAQIKPHFLFNTINSIIALSQMDLERMTAMLNAFSDVLRAKFDFENLDGVVPIENELSIIESYVEIEQIRFGDRLQVKTEIDEDLNVMVPNLSIQPLVENAINHGVMSRDEGGEVHLQVKAVDDGVLVTVTDNGVGMEADMLKAILDGSFSKQSGVGLMNIHQRLKRQYGEGLTIESKVGQGTKVSFNIPK